MGLVEAAVARRLAELLVAYDLDSPFLPSDHEKPAPVAVAWSEIERKLAEDHGECGSGCVRCLVENAVRKARWLARHLFRAG